MEETRCHWGTTWPQEFGEGSPVTAGCLSAPEGRMRDLSLLGWQDLERREGASGGSGGGSKVTYL